MQSIAGRLFSNAAGALALLAGLCLASAPARAETLKLTVRPDTLRADADGLWHASLVLQNDGELGAYPDSLLLEQLNLDPDSSLTPRRLTRQLSGMVRAMGPAGSHDESGLEWSAPAEFTRGQLRFVLYAHDANKQSFKLTSDVIVDGSELADAMPSRVVGTPGTELIVVPADSAARPAPAVVMVLSPGVAARHQVRWARTLHARGYAVVLVSAPGWGLSRGVSDRSGPADIMAADAGIRVALAEPGIDPSRVLLWGHGRGATTSLLASIPHGSLAGIIAVDALLDPASEYATLKGDDQVEFMKVMGRHGAKWNVRSPIERANQIKVPVLLIQTNDAAIKDPAPAKEFEARRVDAKLYIEARVDGREAQPIRRRDADRLALDFLARRTRPAGK